MFSLKDKVIVVTGGNGLLGKVIVDRLSKAGAVAIIADINIGTGQTEFCLDITNEHSVLAFIDQVVKKFKRIDGWVNNAYPRTSDWANKWEDINVDSWKKNIDMHLNGYFICCKHVTILMKKQNSGGTIVNMSSIYGSVGPDFNLYEGTGLTNPAAYSAIKGGIVNLTRYLASYYGKYNIRVNTISPGGIFDNQNQQFVNNYSNKVPLKRMGEPKDISAAVHFLMSDDSKYITGHNLFVDGGWTCI